jgi:hypothetical protein
MAAEHTRIDITQVDFPRLAEEVRRSGRTHVVTRNDEELVEVKPARQRSQRRGKPTSADDPLWNIVGIGAADGPPTDVARNVDTYLAEAYADTHPAPRKP